MDITNILDQAGSSRRWRYDCPVCGVELSRSNFETPATDYYCPVCTTRQVPRQWLLRERTLEMVAS